MGLQFRVNYLEINYEDLTHDPATVLDTVTDWLQLEFLVKVTILQNPANNYGPVDSITRSSLDIVSDNKEKYSRELTRSQLERLEEIVLPVCEDLDYKIVSDNIAYRPLGKIHRMSLEIANLLSSTRIHIEDCGIKRGLQFSWERLRMLFVRK